ncbi:indole-3-glycerol phosphate synthase TrpC [Aphanothece hegewaldii CCALA 016]|uniref:Indole-3-glycerol phosphate synthase n=1 Tax=Aphanothece hegewaldii CCALA 016 TaxID=2107694 RepID=A0A2T1M1E8_9CHRO|nr:indole-3-glycerol phosphate synthase TrpC [Aphanothece hegewaldii]PSF38506.1 indole-3-glycerol phosphate synthase TrpC [Aphanothece hegewaldii CCALA 016]
MLIRRRFPTNTNYTLASCEDQPHNILEKIVWHKEQEVRQMQTQLSFRELQTQLQDFPRNQNFIFALEQSFLKPSLIAEVKRESPSKGIIRDNFDPFSIAVAYEQGGASCLSVLCDRTFFGGSFTYLQAIRKRVSLPLLCKEFIIDPYQIYLARARGADAVLLIAAILCDRDLQDLIDLTHNLGMEPLLEVHSFSECERVLNFMGVRLLGINNRNLEDFTVDLSTTEELMNAYGEEFSQRGIKIVSESGIFTQDDLERVAQAGVTAILVGESLIRQPDLEQAIRDLYHDQFSTYKTCHSVSLPI